MSFPEFQSNEKNLKTSETSVGEPRITLARALGRGAAGLSAGAAIGIGIMIPLGPAIIGSYETAKDTKQAEEYQHTDIAIIPYGIETNDALALSDEIETAFNALTDGLITVNVEVIEPSASALETYETQDPIDCVDKKVTNDFGSHIADMAMAELGEFDKVVALNADPSCGHEAMGVALSPGRYGEVFEVGATWDAYEANGNSQVVVNVDEQGELVGAGYLYSPVSTTMHEMLHLYGLGHNGQLKLSSEFRGESQRLLSAEDDVEHEIKVVDLQAMVRQREYLEYGASGVMGNGVLPLEDGLSTLQKYLLETPLRNLGQDYSIKAFDVNQEKAVFTNENVTGTLAVYSFSEPMSFSNEQSFDRIAFLPYAADDGRIIGLDVYGLTSGSDQVFIDMAANISEVNTDLTIEFGGQSILVELDYTSNKITVSSK